ncbi:Putative nuclease, partial [Frankliniella fusca]
QIKFPMTLAERLVHIERNNRLGLPGVLGMIDGTLAPICPPQKSNQQFYCRKGFTAINVLIVCDADLRILTIDARFPGACHDSYVYHESGIGPVMEQAFAEDNCWLL